MERPAHKHREQGAEIRTRLHDSPQAFGHQGIIGGSKSTQNTSPVCLNLTVKPPVPSRRWYNSRVSPLVSTGVKPELRLLMRDRKRLPRRERKNSATNHGRP